MTWAAWVGIAAGAVVLLAALVGLVTEVVQWLLRRPVEVGRNESLFVWLARRERRQWLDCEVGRIGSRCAQVFVFGMMFLFVFGSLYALEAVWPK